MTNATMSSAGHTNFDSVHGKLLIQESIIQHLLATTVVVRRCKLPDDVVEKKLEQMEELTALLYSRDDTRLFHQWTQRTAQLWRSYCQACDSTTPPPPMTPSRPAIQAEARPTIKTEPEEGESIEQPIVPTNSSNNSTDDQLSQKAAGNLKRPLDTGSESTMKSCKRGGNNDLRSKMGQWFVQLPADIKANDLDSLRQLVSVIQRTKEESIAHQQWHLQEEFILKKALARISSWYKVTEHQQSDIKVKHIQTMLQRRISDLEVTKTVASLSRAIAQPKLCLSKEKVPKSS